MLIKTTCLAVSGAKVTSRRPPRPELCFVVKTTLGLRAGLLEPLADQPALTADLYAEDDDERTGECLYPGDFADWKGNAEVMLRGFCHAPGGRPADEATARLTVGAWSKALRVSGHRGPFTRMELSYANAYGGAGFAPNPVGRGAAGSDRPSVEAIDGAGRNTPRSFAPINPEWMPRVGKRGTLYGPSWRKERAPYFAEDFDWTYFQSAPRDQQLDGFLRGDEEIVLSGLTADAPQLRCRLPGQRVRVFIKDTGGKRSEIGMSLDTLFIDVEARAVTLVWRGLAPVARHDLTDVVAGLVVAEPLGDDRAAGPYHAELDALVDDPTGVRGAFPPEIAERQERKRRMDAGEAMPDEEEIAKLDPVSAIVRRSMGTFAAKEQEELAAQMSAAGPLPEQMKAELAKTTISHGDTPPVPLIHKPGRLPNIGLVHTIRKIMVDVAKVKESLRDQETQPEVAAKIAELDAIPHDPRLFQIDPHYHPPEPLSTEAPGPRANLRERDLSGLDLRGVDLRGADLEDAILIKTDLRGANLAGANLKRAVLFKADATRANLDGADLEGANLASIDLSGATLREANVAMAFFEAARLVEADLSKCKGEYASFVGADLGRAVAHGASLVRADFTGAQLEAASFVGATLTSTKLDDARAFRLDLTRARLDDTRFPGAQMVEARVVDARGHRSVWRGARLDRADFDGAWLTTSFFDDISAVGTQFRCANLRRARLARADLSRADLGDANLFEADLGSARLDKTRFVRAHLYAASFHQAAGAGADFTDANLRRSTLEAAP